MLSFLVIFPNPFIQAKLVTTKTCAVWVFPHFHQFFCGMRRWERKVWRERFLPTLSSFPSHQKPKHVQYLPFYSSHQQCKSGGVWFIVIFFDYLALLVKHFWSSFGTSRIHCSQMLHHIRNVQQMDSGDTQRVLFQKAKATSITKLYNCYLNSLVKSFCQCSQKLLWGKCTVWCKWANIIINRTTIDMYDNCHYCRIISICAQIVASEIKEQWLNSFLEVCFRNSHKFQGLRGSEILKIWTKCQWNNNHSLVHYHLSISFSTFRFQRW